MRVPILLPTKEQLLKIHSALSIDEDRHRITLESFKEWLKSEPHLPDNVGSEYLSQFLMLCKDDLVKAKKKFETNIVCRKNLLGNTSFLSFQTLRERDIARQCVVAPKLTEDGCRIIFAQFPRSVETFDIKLSLKYAVDIGDIGIYEDSAVGTVVVISYSDFTIEMASKLDLATVAEIVKLFINGLPTRVKNYHILNLSAVAKPIFTFVRSALPEKIKSRIIVHDNIENLKNYLPEDLLPQDYGGTLQSLDELSKVWERFYVENDEWKDKVGKLRLKGDVPKDKPHLDPNSGFGTEGTFRNLQVD